MSQLALERCANLPAVVIDAVGPIDATAFSGVAVAGSAVLLRMGIRCPRTDVFGALVDPTVITKFWIEESTGALEEGATLRWTMNSEGAVAEVKVTTIEPNERIGFDWGADGQYTSVEFKFAPWGEGGTLVKVKETGLTGSADGLVARAADSTGGFTMVLCSLKALVEYEIQLAAVTDRNPTA